MKNAMDAAQQLEGCCSLLRELQNSDGGWGFQPQARSRVEPTCWAHRALANAKNPNDTGPLSRARKYLRSAQLPDGSWPATPEMRTGSWVTSLVCAILSQDAEAPSAALRGLEWLCEDFPRDSSLFLRLLRRLWPGPNVDEQDDALRGWGWSPRTSSWVEPTAFALMAMQEFAETQLPALARRRRELAVKLLYDRMCPGGGWNCGNPRVYGVDGESLVLPTAWALLALRREPEHKRKTLSLAWLAAEFPKIESPASLAVASVCLETYGRALPWAKRELLDFRAEELACDGIHVLAWNCLALNKNRGWPGRRGELN